MKKLIATIVFLVLILAVSAGTVWAGEGTILIRYSGFDIGTNHIRVVNQHTGVFVIGQVVGGNRTLGDGEIRVQAPAGNYALFCNGKEVKVFHLISGSMVSIPITAKTGVAQVNVVSKQGQPSPPPPGFDRQIQMGTMRYNHRITNPKTNGPGWQVYEGMSNDTILRQHKPGETLYVQGGFSPEYDRTTKHITDDEQAEMVTNFRVPDAVERMVRNYGIPRGDIVILEPSNQMAGVLIYKLPEPIKPTPQVVFHEVKGLEEAEGEMEILPGNEWVFHLKVPARPSQGKEAEFGMKLILGGFALGSQPYSSFSSGGLGRIVFSYGRLGVYGEGTIGAEFMRPGGGMIVRSHQYGAGLTYDLTERWTLIGGWLHTASSFNGDGPAEFTSNGGGGGFQFRPKEYLVLELMGFYSKLKNADRNGHFENNNFYLQDDYGLRLMIGLELFQLFGGSSETETL